MNRTLRASIGCVLIIVIMFAAVVVTSHIGKRIKVDITDQQLYTLSDGTKAILAKLNQPIKLKLYYASSAAMEASDEIMYFNNYYQYVKSLLEEYQAHSNGMVQLEILDPEPYSQAEEEAIRYGLTSIPMDRIGEVNFYFGLVLQTQFGVEKVIEFFSPARQRFIEYDISYLIDTAITREKNRIGVLSSLEVMGEDVSSYMAQMKMRQGQSVAQPWGIVRQLRTKYDVEEIPTDANSIDGIDLLLVIHPKDLPEQTLFAIDQYVLKGNPAVFFIDPHCMVDQPAQANPYMQGAVDQSSNLSPLLRAWGLEMDEMTFAGDRQLALPFGRRSGSVIGYLGLTNDCFNQDKVITAELDRLEVLFAGVLKERQTEADIQRVPLISTTDNGNEWKVSSPYELGMRLDPKALMNKFVDGSEPVHIGYMVTGRFESAYPEGVTIEREVASEASGDPNQTEEPKVITENLTGLKESVDNSSVAVFADVDMISDMLAYGRGFFGGLAVRGDGSALVLNTIEDLSGSSELISIRSRGEYEREFEVVEAIEAEAEKQTLAEENRINAEIQRFEQELNELLRTDQSQEVIGSNIVERKKELDLKILQAQRELQDVKRRRRESIERLGTNLANFNMFLAPGIILLIALVVWLVRAGKKQKYINQIKKTV